MNRSYFGRERSVPRTSRQVTVTATALLSCIAIQAHELTEKLSLDGVVSAAMQCQDISEPDEAKATCKGAIPLQPELTYRPGEHDRLFVKLGFAAGNGLNGVTPFNIPPWGADLEDDVENINGSGRDYLLEAWYEHVVEFDRRNRLGLVLGIIDASQYLDQNAYANDEYLQFMNPALSNAPNSFFPAYDLGIAAEWHVDNWSFSGVLMDVHQVMSPEKYTFYGLQAAYRLESKPGVGNYRALINGDRNFIDLTGQSRQKNDIVLFSIDQEFGRIIGVFSRIGWRLDDEPINYRAIYSGGIDINGAAWGRILDNIGVGLVFLDGGNNKIHYTRIAEAYYRMVINPHLAITGDVQYMRDEYLRNPGAAGFVYSLRTTLNF